MCRPKRAEVVVEIGERGKFLAQLAGAHVAVVIDNSSRFAGGTGKGPRRGASEVCVLSAVVRGNGPDVSNILDETLARIIIRKHAIAVTLCESGNVFIHFAQHFTRHLLDLVANQSFSANNIEILAVELKVPPHELAQFINLRVVISTDDGIGVKPKAIHILRFEWIE